MSDDEELGSDQVRYERSQPVVVAEGGLQLVDADRVVLVDDGDGPELENRVDCVPHVQIPHAVVDILSSQQHLGGMNAMFAERPVVGLNERDLSDGRHRLQLGQVGRAGGELQPADPGADGPAADEDHSAFLLADGLLSERDELFRQAVDPLVVQGAVRPSQDPGANLDDNGGSGREQLLAKWIGHKESAWEMTAAASNPAKQPSGCDCISSGPGEKGSLEREILVRIPLP
jgi:hypothetical protein